MQVQYRAIVTGRVQGVGFRYYALRAANEWSVGGWVQNLDDGSVELFLQGEEENIQRMLQKIREGTLWIQVDSLAAKRLDFDENRSERDFFIKY